MINASHRICAQWRQGIKLIERGLDGLYRMHAGVNGASQSLLS